MKKYIINSILATVFSLVLFTSCKKDAPDFGSAFKRTSNTGTISLRNAPGTTTAGSTSMARAINPIGWGTQDSIVVKK